MDVVWSTTFTTADRPAPWPKGTAFVAARAAEHVTVRLLAGGVAGVVDLVDDDGALAAGEERLGDVAGREARAAGQGAPPPSRPTASGCRPLRGVGNAPPPLPTSFDAGVGMGVDVSGSADVGSARAARSTSYDVLIRT